MKSLKRIFFRFFANRYLSRRGQVPTEELKQRTLESIRRFQEKAQNLTQEQLNARPAIHPLLGPGDFKRWLVINMVHLERHYKQLLHTPSSRES